MAGLADILGYGDSPFYKALSPYSNTIANAGVGLASGRNWTEGIQNAIAGAAGGNAADKAYQKQLREEEENKAKLNHTIEFMKAKYPDLAQAVEAGYSITEAYNEMFRREQGGSAEAFTLGPGDVRYGADGEVIAQVPAVGKTPDAPSGYQWTPEGAQTFVPGGPADPTNPLNRRRAEPMTESTRKEIFEAEDAATAGGYVIDALDRAILLNDKAYDGPGAKVRGGATGLFGNAEGQATLELDNVTTELALNQLKTIFGAMPTEGERKILLELQGSVDMPKAVRKSLFERAKRLALRRIEENRRKAGDLRSGEYFQPGYAGGASADDPLGLRGGR